MNKAQLQQFYEDIAYCLSGNRTADDVRAMLRASPALAPAPATPNPTVNDTYDIHDPPDPWDHALLVEQFPVLNIIEGAHARRAPSGCAPHAAPSGLPPLPPRAGVLAPPDPPPDPWAKALGEK